MFIRNTKNTLPKVINIIKKYELAVKPEDFYNFVDSIKLKSYIRIKIVRELWQGTSKGRNSNENSKIFRILSYEFFS
jgi:hypothetical protein